VHVRFRVLEDGRVDPESVQVIRSTNELFDEPSIRAIEVLRFLPAKVG
jgi:TonB family protein